MKIHESKSCFIPFIAFVAILLLGISCKPKVPNDLSNEQTAVREKPNFLFIAVDDLNDWTGFLQGHPQTITPNMDKLAASGMVFDRAYCAASVCNPSRAAIMSGYRPSTSGVYQNGQKPFENELIKKSVMLPQHFSKHGYRTFSRGKIYHTPNTGKDTWDVWERTSGNYGQNEGREGIMKNGIPEGQMPHNMDWEATDAPTEETPDYLNAAWAASVLTQNHDKPFFIGLGIFRPHLEWNVPKEFFDLFDLDALIMPTILETDLEDVGENTKPTKEYLTIKKYGKEREAVRAYLASIAYADYCIGKVLDALEKSKYAENTIVVLWGDHGWHLGEKLRYKKFTLWDRAARVPLIIKAPGVTKSGSSTGRTVNLLDLYPTLSSLAGIPINEKNDGMDISPLLKNPDMEWDHPSLTQMGEGRNSLRSERFRYIRYADGEEELYDHSKDEQEWNNVANDPEYQAVKLEMSIRLDAILNPTRL